MRPFAATTERPGRCPFHGGLVVTVEFTLGGKGYCYFWHGTSSVEPGNKATVVVCGTKKDVVVTYVRKASAEDRLKCLHSLRVGKIKPRPMEEAAWDFITKDYREQHSAIAKAWDKEVFNEYNRQAEKTCSALTGSRPHTIIIDDFVTTKDTPMIKITEQTLVNGRDINSFSDSEIISLLRTTQDEIETLSQVVPAPKRFEKKIQELKDGRAALIELLDKVDAED